MKNLFWLIILLILPTISFAQNSIFNKIFKTTNQECQTDQEAMDVLETLINNNLSMDLSGLRYFIDEKVYDILISGLLFDNSDDIKRFCIQKLYNYLHPQLIKNFSTEINDILKKCDKKQLRELSSIAVFIDLDSNLKKQLLSVNYLSIFEKAMLGDVMAQKKLIANFRNEKDFLQRLYLAKKIGCLGTKEALQVLLEEFADNKVYNNYIDYNSSKYIAIVGLQYYRLEPLFNKLGKVCNDYLFYKNQYSDVDFNDNNAIKQKEYLLSVAKYLKKNYHFKIELKNDDFLEYFEAREIDYDE